MEVTILIVLIIIGLVFIVSGLFTKQYLIFLFGGVVLLLGGVFLLNGVSFVSGVIVNNLNSTASEVTNVYTTWRTSFTTPLSILLMVLGLGITIMGILLTLGSSPKDVEFEDLEDG